MIKSIISIEKNIAKEIKWVLILHHLFKTVVEFCASNENISSFSMSSLKIFFCLWYFYHNLIPIIYMTENNNDFELKISYNETEIKLERYKSLYI